jgi:hypothetical protein
MGSSVYPSATSREEIQPMGLRSPIGHIGKAKPDSAHLSRRMPGEGLRRGQLEFGACGNLTPDHLTQLELFFDSGKRVDSRLQIALAVSSRNLGANPGRTFRNHRIKEADHVNA